MVKVQYVYVAPGQDFLSQRSEQHARVYVVLCYLSINAATSKTEELKLLRSVNAFKGEELTYSVSV